MPGRPLSRPRTSSQTFFSSNSPPPPKKKKKQALLQLEYPDKLQRLLLTPQREVLVELVITRDNGEIEVKGGGFEKEKRTRRFSDLRNLFSFFDAQKEKKNDEN